MDRHPQTVREKRCRLKDKRNEIPFFRGFSSRVEWIFGIFFTLATAVYSSFALIYCEFLCDKVLRSVLRVRFASKTNIERFFGFTRESSTVDLLFTISVSI